MKLKEFESNVTRSEGIEQFKVSIDVNNLEFITQLLSSNLYSNPQKSFIREIISNAWDSQIEAGNTGQPILVKIKGKTVSIRDFGTGLSPERFNQIYRNIGSSTKRDSNDYIGSFGIGRFSAMACSDRAYITSYYQGREYCYIMIKDGSRINIDRIGGEEGNPTEEQNGLMVSITVDNTQPFLDAMKYVAFFPNIYLDSDGIIDKDDDGYSYRRGRRIDFNTIKIRHYTHFACGNYLIQDKLLIGNVLYPIDKFHFNGDLPMLKFLSAVDNSNIVFKFAIGELDITPSRESINYTKNTIDIIRRRITEAKKEMDDILNPYIHKDFDNLWEYAEAIYRDLNFDFMTQTPYQNGTTPPYYCYKIDNTDFYHFMTYKGRKLEAKGKNANNIYWEIQTYYRITPPKFRGFVADNRWTEKTDTRIGGKHSARIKNEQFLCIPADTRLLPPMKAYIMANYNEYDVVEKPTKEEFINHIKNSHYDPFDCFGASEKGVLLNDCYEQYIAKFKYEDFTSAEYIKFKDNYYTERKKLKGVIENIYLYESFPYCSYYINRIHYDNTNKAIEALKKMNSFESTRFSQYRGFILAEYNCPERNLLQQACDIHKWYYFEAREKTIKIIRDAHLSNEVSISYALMKDPYLKKMAAIYYYAKKNNKQVFPLVYGLSSFLPEEVFNDISKMEEEYDLLSGKYAFITQVIDPLVQSGVYDEYYYYLCNEIVKAREALEKAKDIVRDCLKADEFIGALAIRLKLRRINNSLYQRVKNNKLIQYLCNSKK